MKYETSVHSSLCKKFSQDLEMIGLSDSIKDVTLVIRPYSESFFGRYFPKDKKIALYPSADRYGSRFYNYQDLFKTLVHEVCHHIQIHSTSYVRLKGVMHNSDFWRINNHYISVAVEKGILSDGHRIRKQSETVFSHP